MRVLLVSGSFPPMRCGVGDYCYRLAGALAAIPGVRVGVLTSIHGKQAAQADAVEIFPVIGRWRVSEAPSVVKIIRNWSPDIVHIQYPTQGYGDDFLQWLLPGLGFLMGKKVVQTWHESYGRRSAPKLFLKAIVPGGLVVVRPNYRDSLPVSLRWALWNKHFVIIRNASPFRRAELNEPEKDELRRRYLKGQKRLVVFFGFVYPNKGADLLFDIADPVSDHIVIAGETVETSDLHQKLMKLAQSEPWAGKVTVTGFLPAADIAGLLAVADAVILPYRVGGGEWNTSIHAAVLQGSLVITTSRTPEGYDEKHNLFSAGVDDVQEMKRALEAYAGRKRSHDPGMDGDVWKEIAYAHRSLYDAVLAA